MPFVKDDPRINRIGRKPGVKNKLTLVKDRVVAILNGRLDDWRKVEELDTQSLLRFVAAVMPKDISMKIKPDLTYIDSVPRKKIEKPKYKTIDMTIDNTIDDKTIDSQTIEPSTNDKAMVDNSQGNDNDNSTDNSTDNSNGDVNTIVNTSSNAQPAPHIKESLSSLVKEKKYGRAVDNKEVVSEVVSPKTSKP